MDPTRLALEATLRDCPDDTAAHAAYADYLAEHDDPRGDYIRLQLAHEDKDQPAARLRAMEQEALTLLRRHERDWLGPLYPFVHPERRNRSVAEPVGPAVDVTYRRGWLHGVQVRGLTMLIAQALAACPLAAMLSELDVGPVEDSGRQVDAAPFEALAAAPVTATLRRLTVAGLSGAYTVPGDPDSTAKPFVDLVKNCGRLTHLDVDAGGLDTCAVMSAVHHDVEWVRLVVSFPHFGPSGIPHRVLSRLADLHGEVGWNLTLDDHWRDAFAAALAASLPAVRRVTLRIPGLGDHGVQALLASGIVDRLIGLDLCRCGITDDGARLLAAHPAVPRLEYLRLADNYLSPMGIEDLAAVGVTVSEQQQFGVPPGGFEDPPPAGDELEY